MNHQEHIQLISEGIIKRGGVWADMGSGEGAFTLALREILGEDAEIYSVDKNPSSLKKQERIFMEMFPKSRIRFLESDFQDELPLPKLDGIIAANSLHFIKEKVNILEQFKQYLRPNGRLIIVEYNVDQGNTWVPYPFSFDTCVSIVKEAGFEKVTQLDAIPSSFLQQIYSAVAY